MQVGNNVRLVGTDAMEKNPAFVLGMILAPDLSQQALAEVKSLVGKTGRVIGVSDDDESIYVDFDEDRRDFHPTGWVSHCCGRADELGLGRTGVVLNVQADDLEIIE